MKSILSKNIHFSCGHRISNPDWDVEKNKEVYGKDYSEEGFGHNFTFEVFVSSPVNSNTDQAININEVSTVLEKVSKLLDHKFLNEDVDYFKKNVPTTENIAHFCYHEYKKLLQPSELMLEKIRLHEGDNLFIDVFEESS